MLHVKIAVIGITTVTLNAKNIRHTGLSLAMLFQKRAWMRGSDHIKSKQATVDEE